MKGLNKAGIIALILCAATASVNGGQTILPEPLDAAPGSRPTIMTSGSYVPKTKTTYVMIFPFAQVGDVKSHSWVGGALAEDLSSQAGADPSVKAVPFDKLQGAADQRGALASAKTAGAQFVVFGTYQFLNDQIRVTGHLYDVARNSQVAPLTAAGDVRQFFSIEDNLGSQLKRALATATDVPSQDQTTLGNDNNQANHSDLYPYDQVEQGGIYPYTQDDEGYNPNVDYGYPVGGYYYTTDPNYYAYPYYYGTPYTSFFFYGGIGGYYHHHDYYHDHYDWSHHNHYEYHPGEGGYRSPGSNFPGWNHHDDGPAGGSHIYQPRTPNYGQTYHHYPTVHSQNLNHGVGIHSSAGLRSASGYHRSGGIHNAGASHGFGGSHNGGSFHGSGGHVGGGSGGHGGGGGGHR